LKKKQIIYYTYDRDIKDNSKMAYYLVELEDAPIFSYKNVIGKSNAKYISFEEMFDKKYISPRCKKPVLKKDKINENENYENYVSPKNNTNHLIFPLVILLIIVIIMVVTFILFNNKNKKSSKK
jgi:hypothetical protein